MFLFLNRHKQESIINEIELMRNINHKNVISLHEVYETENSLYMVLELLKGNSLFSKIK